MTGVCEKHSLFIKLRKIWLEAATCEPRTPKTEEQVSARAPRAPKTSRISYCRALPRAWHAHGS